jgi:hypothetical protein
MGQPYQSVSLNKIRFHLFLSNNASSNLNLQGLLHWGAAASGIRTLRGSGF